ncbi:MAG TPA: molybdopterin converting factor subunit 1 [Planctomycetes bacterium]|nr:molybdopterin converting factor subunit 1 [Planctomycetota bacterium]HIN81062.1 molybdopterin converting factor subunit 1 [Planctomycetota bacterium]
MRFSVLLFASLRDRAGSERIEIEIAEGATLNALLEAIEVQQPELSGRLAAVRVAVDEEFRDGDHPLSEGNEIALIPPVSGG